MRGSNAASNKRNPSDKRMPSLCYKFHMPKLMPILEKNNEFHDHLKRIAGRMDINIKSLRISRKQLSHFLRERYKPNAFLALLRKTIKRS